MKNRFKEFSGPFWFEVVS